MLRFFFLLTLPLQTLETPPSHEEENLHVRRIEALWHDKDNLFLSRQLKEFCLKFPDSPSISRFTAMLGDLSFQEKRFEEAHCYYEQISDPLIQKCVQGKKWHSAYRCGHTHDLMVEITPALIKESPEARFYYAEACTHE